ncbi:adenylate/guanylate cyclase catalytic domain protein [Necator americanus]|uniref:guanylate cyclase n=1 Tax=Necator americanus TaxID=51031 RepID=W2TNC2_NECAM|nr:adenylate/guanylate cyclase catalytic domain protein [Necator americanus]ETN83174.1 adenylate/guanylate cyclase catalytic domain protein [Necator americanus]
MHTNENIKQAVHDNLNPFLGMAFNEKAEMLLFWKFCSRGTLQDIIYNENFVLDEKFHGAFLRDITLGLEYLHLSNIGFHGSLTTWSTLIDRNWLVKLTDYGISDAVRRWVKHGSISEETVNDGGEKTDATQKTVTKILRFYYHVTLPAFASCALPGILYVAPEIRLSNDKNKNRRLDQAWIGQTLERRRSADIYAFGVVMYEILFRNFPFSDKTDLNEMSTKAMEGEKICRPQVQKDKQLHPDLQALLQDCWHDSPDARPTIRRVRLSTESILKTKGSLVDSMTRMMEEYANNLEKLVSERTGMLEQATVRADKLLSQLLPKYVANELKNGRPVPPKLYTSATVFFSDVVGFTTLCSSSSPIEVVNLLNSVYSGFDEIINKRDGYKVETIGDAYMVVSGVPEENGRRHICNIADISLEIMEVGQSVDDNVDTHITVDLEFQFLVTYRIPHRKSERLVIRVGFHSGSVAAAVVGLNSPRYCLFGDTVNLASRMESTGEPGKIQISQESKDLLANDYPEFVTVKRGIMEVKGKGERTTYWLLSKDRSCFNT